MTLIKPVSVRTFEALHKRMTFDYHQQKRFENSQLGWQGESQFSARLSQQSFPHLVIYDSEFKEGLSPQLDFIVIGSAAIYLYDVKHWQGNYHYTDGSFTHQNRHIDSPLTQLNRAYDTLSKLTHHMPVKLPIIKQLVFTNPDFTLYGNQPELPIVLVNQLDNHFKTVERTAQTLSDYHYDLYNIIQNRKVINTTYDTEIAYNYQDLQKGMWCKSCFNQKMCAGRRHYYCPSCHSYELKSSALERSLKDFHLLFPKQEIGAHQLIDWSGGQVGRFVSSEIIKKQPI